MEASNRRPAPIPPLNLQINNSNQNNNNNLNFPQQFDSSTSNNYMNGGSGVRSSSRGGGSNGSTSPAPLSPSLSSNERLESSSGGGIQVERSSLRSTSPSSNFNSNLTTTTNPDTAAFSSDYDSPSLSSIASVQTASLLTATRLSSPVLSPTAHLFGGGIVSPIREESRNGGGGSTGRDSSEGDTSRTSGFELVDDVPTTKKGLSSNTTSPRKAMGGSSIGGNGDLLSALGNGNGNGYLYGDRPSIQQSESYNSIDSNGWRTDSSSDSPAFTSVMDMLGKFLEPFSAQNFLINSTLRLTDFFLVFSILGPQTRKLSNAPWDASELSAGPKARKLTKAPWEDDDADSIMSVSSYAPRTKEIPKNVLVKPKQTLRSRSRSFGTLGIRRGHSEDGPSGEESFQASGLGVDLAQNGNASSSTPTQTLSRSPKGVKDRLTASRGDSILEITGQPSKPWDPIMIRKGSSNSDVGITVPPFQQPLSYVDPAHMAQQEQEQLSRPSYNRAGSSERGLTPLVFDRSSPTPTTPPLPHSAPPFITSFSADDKKNPRSVSAGSTTTQSRSLHSTSPTTPSFPPTTNISAPFSAVMGYDGTALTSNSGTGYKLISLEVARQRETERVAAAAASRKAQLPVENRPETTYSSTNSSNNSNSNSNPTSTGRKSSYGKEESSGASTTSSSITAPPHPTLKNKRSGFLKRMLGGGDKVVPPLPTATSIRLESEETYRAIDDEYDIGSLMLKKTSPPSSNAPIVITLASPLPSLHSTSTFTSSASFNQFDTEDDSKHTGLAPSLALRPISMFTGFGLPDNFLATISKQDIVIQEDTPRTQGTKSPTGAVPSPLVLTPSTSYPFLTSPTESNASTPLAPRFPTSATHSTLHASATSNQSTPSPDLKPLPSPTSANNPMSYYEPQALETYTELQQRFTLATLEWKGLQEDYEYQIKILRAEVERYKAEGAGGESATQSFVTVEESHCSKCHVSFLVDFLTFSRVDN